MDYYPKNFINNLTILLITIFFAFIILLCFWTSFSFHNKYLPSSSLLSTSLNESTGRDDKLLEQALRRASMGKKKSDEKTVIITIVNKAYVDEYPAMFDLFLEGFWVGEGTRSLLENLLVVAVDQTAYRRCKFRRLNCYRLEVTGDAGSSVDFAEEKLYMSDDFINMMWTRTHFLLRVLKRGYNFIFTDTDVLWLRNPLPKLNLTGTDDLQISTDSFNGHPRSELNAINTGFYYIRSNNKTISLFENWYDSRTNATGLKEQDVLAKLIRGGVIGRLGLTVRFLDTLYFSGFCSDSRDIRAVSTVHANCCRSIRAKITDLTAVLRDWIRFRRPPPPAAAAAVNGGGVVVVRRNDSTENAFLWSRHNACASSWQKSVGITP